MGWRAIIGDLQVRRVRCRSNFCQETVSNGLVEELESISKTSAASDSFGLDLIRKSGFVKAV
jgi:hypothetical protein